VLRLITLTASLAMTVQAASAQPAPKAASAQPAPKAASAQPAPKAASVETQATFTARCVRDMVAANPRAKGWAQDSCQQDWDRITAAGPVAEAILAAAPSTPAPIDPRALPARLPMVKWRARPQGTLSAQGNLGKFDVQLDRKPALSFNWGAAGELVPYNAVAALRGRGAEVKLIGCVMYGAGEASQTFRVAAPARVPFMLTVYGRDAPTANAQSFYNVTLDLSGKVQTLAQLRRDGNEWVETCPH
jgi:hypothetical protein